MDSNNTDVTTTALAALHLTRRDARDGFDAVRPATLRGTIKVVSWLAMVAGIVLLGRTLVPALGLAWVLIALAVMVPIALWWPKRRPPVS